MVLLQEEPKLMSNLELREELREKAEKRGADPIQIARECDEKGLSTHDAGYVLSAFGLKLEPDGARVAAMRINDTETNGSVCVGFGATVTKAVEDFVRRAQVQS